MYRLYSVSLVPQMLPFIALLCVPCSCALSWIRSCWKQSGVFFLLMRGEAYPTCFSLAFPTSPSAEEKTWNWGGLLPCIMPSSLPWILLLSPLTLVLQFRCRNSFVVWHVSQGQGLQMSPWQETREHPHCSVCILLLAHTPGGLWSVTDDSSMATSHRVNMPTVTQLRFL